MPTAEGGRSADKCGDKEREKWNARRRRREQKCRHPDDKSLQSAARLSEIFDHLVPTSVSLCCCIFSRLRQTVWCRFDMTLEENKEKINPETVFFDREFSSGTPGEQPGAINS